MGFRLRLYDEGGSEIGWMLATRTDPAPVTPWRSPCVYEWQLTHPEPERWDGMLDALRHSVDPHERGKTGEGVIESEDFTFVPDRIYRTDEDGPEAYLEEVSRFAEQCGAASTEIVEE